MKKATLWDVIGNEFCMYPGSYGWECIITKKPGEPEQYQIPRKRDPKNNEWGYSKEECAAQNKDLKNVGKLCRLYVKGLKKLFKNEYQPKIFEQMKDHYCGVRNPDLANRFRKIMNCFPNGIQDIIKIGEGSHYSITDFVDGSFAGNVREV